MISSLRFRMMLAVSLIAVTAVVAVALAARQRTHSEFRRFQALEKISTSSSPDGDLKPVAALLERRCCEADALRAATAVLSPDEVLIIADASDRIIAKTGKPLDALSAFKFSRKDSVVGLEAVRHDHGGATTGVNLRFQIDGFPLRKADGNTAYVYVLPMPSGEAERPGAVFLGSVDHSLLLTTVVIATLALLATWIFAHRIAGPIEELRTATRDLALGDLGRRVDTNGPDEIGALSRSFNAMAGELENQQTLRRNLIQDVVHELRTPLAALRCRIDAIIDGVSMDPRKDIAGANEEIDHLSRLVGDLHELALAEARELKLTISEAPLAPIVDSAARAAGLEGDTRLHVVLDNNLVIRGDAVRLRQVVLNILSNAARHTPTEGTITVRAFQRHREIVVGVHNTGSSLAARDIAHIFDRFYRVDPSRERASGGTGLGLSIVKNLIEAQGGRVWCCCDGSGVSFAFAMPSSPVSIGHDANN